MIPVGAPEGAGSPELARLRRLTDISRALTHTSSLGQVAKLAAEHGAQLLDAPAAVLMLAGSDGELTVRATHGIEESRVDQLRGPLQDVQARLQALFRGGADCTLAVPLIVGGNVTGLLAVALDDPPTSSDEWFLSALADQAAVALEGARLGGEVRQEMEDRLRASEGQTNAKDRALATLAHDIRSPLAAIDGYSWNLQDGLYGPISEPQRHALDRIRVSGQHLLSLLESVMDMARLNAGTVPVEAEPVDCRRVAREAVDMLAPAATARRQQLALEDGEPLTVLGNSARLRQVLVNLIGNAVKFTPEEGTIAVTSRTMRLDERPWGEIRVADSGPGIPEAEQRAIFEAYYRSADTAALPGIGLGLAISHALIAQMGGALDVRSEPGAGSEFTIRLPLGAGEARPG